MQKKFYIFNTRRENIGFTMATNFFDADFFAKQNFADYAFVCLSKAHIKPTNIPPNSREAGKN